MTQTQPPATPPQTPPTPEGTVPPPSEPPAAPPAAPPALDAGQIGAAALTAMAKELGFDSVKDMKKAVRAQAKKADAPPPAEPTAIDPEVFNLTKASAEIAEKLADDLITEAIADAPDTIKAALSAIDGFDDLSAVQKRAAFKQAKAMAAKFVPPAAPPAPPKPPVPGHSPAAGSPDSVKATMKELYAKAMDGDKKARAEWVAMKAKHPEIISNR